MIAPNGLFEYSGGFPRKPLLELAGGQQRVRVDLHRAGVTNDVELLDGVIEKAHLAKRDREVVVRL